MWLNLCNFADTVVMDAEEEESKCGKTISDEGERNKRLFTRKTSSYLVKRGYSQQNHENLNGTPTFYKTKTPQNPRCSQPVVYDEEEEERGETLPEDTLKILMGLLLLRHRSTTFVVLSLLTTRLSPRRRRLKGLQTLNYQSSRSSCLTENTSRKKAKIAPLPRRVPRETPKWLVKMMGRMDGAEEPRLIFETALTASDVNPLQSRLLIPLNKLLRNDFLTTAEVRAISRIAVRKEDKENIGMGTIFVSQRIKKWGLRFKIWKMYKKYGNGALNYALNWDWNEVVERNDLKVDDKIRLWTFRWRGVLFFALDTE